MEVLWALVLSQPDLHEVYFRSLTVQTYSIGGSIRNPASFTGLWALRPSVGRVSYQVCPLRMDSQSLLTSDLPHTSVSIIHSLVRRPSFPVLAPLPILLKISTSLCLLLLLSNHGFSIPPVFLFRGAKMSLTQFKKRSFALLGLAVTES